MSQPWVRLWRQALHDPKIVTLPDRQHRAWTNCLLIADDDGNLPPLRDIASHLRMTVADAEQLIIDLVEAELIDASTDAAGRRSYRMHAWDKWQFRSDNSTERSRRHRSKRNDDATLQKRPTPVAATAPDPDPDTEPEETPLPPEQDAASEKGKAIASLMGAGRGGEPSVEAKRTVARLLGLGEVEPLVAIYLDWRPSARARDPDALFRRTAPKLLANAPPAVRAACRPLAETGPPEPLPAVSRPSSNLMNTKLVQGSRRHAHRLVS